MLALENKISDLLLNWKYKNLDVLSSRIIASDLVNSLDKLDKEALADFDPKLLKDILNTAGSSKFFKSITSKQLHEQWTNILFKLIQVSNYSLLDMFKSRVELNPDKTLLQNMSQSPPDKWSYKKVDNLTQRIAALFYSMESEPRVAIFSANSPESAASDLACLFYDILNTPLNIHFDENTLADIFDQLSINIVVTDTPKRFEILLNTLSKVKTKFKIITLDEKIQKHDDVYNIDESINLLSAEKTQHFINSRIIKPVNQIATVMYTSGTTGKAKGISFSIYNLVSKRFARGVALPDVGKNEVILCYLPLFHTFGRYLELLGMIYWNGTYVFSGSPSIRSLLSMFPEVNPTGFISIPLRWIQIYDKIFNELDNLSLNDQSVQQLIIKSVVGKNLRWGLSAAGYLDPKIFKFFNRNGVELCSGFGMTEATGGITMTLPGKYVENSTGKPLPGIETKLSENGELHIAGHYVAKYFNDDNLYDTIEFPEDKLNWIATGDIFKNLDDDNLVIVDRVKDIYKNNRGQTVAPRNIENKFEGVPGIKRVFLVGDGRAYNILFIVPDFDDEILMQSDEKTKKEYFHQIITAANQHLAPFERVINFKILERDFSIEDGELTQKKTYNRKKITQNFISLIESAYQKKHIEIVAKDFTLKIPKWLIRDLGILENDITLENNKLINHRLCKEIVFKRNDLNPNRFCIGNLEYEINGDVVDFGTLIKQPKLWAGNPTLVNFAKCREVWENPLKMFSGYTFIQSNNPSTEQVSISPIKFVRNDKLAHVHELVSIASFFDTKQALEALDQLQDYIIHPDEYISELVKYRLMGLSTHPEEEIRCRAYMILIIEKLDPHQTNFFPAFLESGKSFLNEKYINLIAQTSLEKRRLEALRSRLYTYRNALDWPVDENKRRQLENIFRLLVNFAKNNRLYYDAIRTELVNWMMLSADEELALSAKKYFQIVSKDFESNLIKETTKLGECKWNTLLSFDDSISDHHTVNLKHVLIDTAFIKQSIILGFDEPNFDVENIIQKGIWISRIGGYNNHKLFRICVTIKSGRKYNLLLVLANDIDTGRSLETIYWLMLISSYPFGPKVLPRLGCCRPELKAMSVIYKDELNAWEKIRYISSEVLSLKEPKLIVKLQQIFTKAISAFVRGWKYSGKQIIPGTISLSNVIVNELDHRENSSIISLNGWTECHSSIELIHLIVKNFYQKILAHYHWAGYKLNLSWIFDSFMEVFDEEDSYDILSDLQNQLEKNDVEIEGQKLSMVLDQYMKFYTESSYLPIDYHSAVESYDKQIKLNSNATKSAQLELVMELYGLFRLERFNSSVRYYFYLHTYFVAFDKPVKSAFKKLLTRMLQEKNVNTTSLLELSDLQDTLSLKEDLEAFSKMVFPTKTSKYNLSIEKNLSYHTSIIKTNIYDKFRNKYQFYESDQPSEVGILYRLFYKENFSKSLAPEDKFFILSDNNERIIGGLSYKIINDETAFLDATVVSYDLAGQGLGRAMIEEFCSRMQTRNIKIIKTHVLSTDFYNKLGFIIDSNWGVLVKFI